MDEYNNNNNVNPNPYGSPEPPAQPDYANQYNQQPVQPDYANQYNQQPVQPDYANQYNQQPQQPDYANQYNQQPQQPDYASQYNQQPQQPDYSAQYDQYNQANNGYAQQPYQPQPMGGYDAAPNNEVLAGPAKVFSIISMVSGIVAMVSCCYGGFIFGIAAIVFSILAKKRFTGKNTMATLGLVFGIVGLAIATISAIVICVIGVSEGGTTYHTYY